MPQAISASRLAGLLGDFDRSPAYAGLADALALLVGDGRIGRDVRLPSERDLTSALGVSRTTVTRAYAVLREHGYAHARHGSGTFTRIPGGRAQALDRVLRPHADGDVLTDLTVAAGKAPAGLATLYAEAVSDLPVYLGGHGYFPTGLPALQSTVAEHYRARGLPTDPDQILITSGALSAIAVVLHTVVSPGERVALESPTYPNASEAVRTRGARPVALPVEPTDWDIAAMAETLHQTQPRLAYLVPDFQNPTGHLMDDAQRAQLAHALRSAGTVALVDETLWPLALDGQRMPRPLAAHADGAITVGSTSKAFWGGLRLGWIRAPHRWVEPLTRTRVSLDLGAPVLEQLVAHRLLGAEQILAERRRLLRAQRDAVVTATAELLPEWRLTLPGGGLSLWIELPTRAASRLAAAATRRGVAVTPGPAFAVEGGMDSFLRLPFAHPADELREAVGRLAVTWEAVRAGSAAGRRPRVVLA
ncbi:PLP-dependent aminotransferase family protein [Georgenia alba]|uniref:PLP-dependent aminotransferase family protein n=1 Tax=Georgenia alba TaxID=2233858 RepID=A0ABW2Q409_9MICO